MNEEIKEMWVDSFLDHHQGHGCLHQIKDGRNFFCPLGILVDLYQKVSGTPLVTAESKMGRDLKWVAYGDEGDIAYLPQEVADWAELSSRCPGVPDARGREVHLSTLNDTGHDFEYIARMVKEHL